MASPCHRAGLGGIRQSVLSCEQSCRRAASVLAPYCRAALCPAAPHLARRATAASVHNSGRIAAPPRHEAELGGIPQSVLSYEQAYRRAAAVLPGRTPLGSAEP